MKELVPGLAARLRKAQDRPEQGVVRRPLRGCNGTYAQPHEMAHEREQPKKSQDEYQSYDNHR
jgi:hypothetical protein